MLNSESYDNGSTTTIFGLCYIVLIYSAIQGYQDHLLLTEVKVPIRPYFKTHIIFLVF